MGEREASRGGLPTDEMHDMRRHDTNLTLKPRGLERRALQISRAER